MLPKTGGAEGADLPHPHAAYASLTPSAALCLVRKQCVIDQIGAAQGALDIVRKKKVVKIEE